MSLYIKWIGQGGYILSDGLNSICIDPYLSDIVERISGKKRLYQTIIKPEELESKLIICTHDHLDHLDKDAIMRMDKSDKTFAGPDSCISHLNSIGIIVNYSGINIYISADTEYDEQLNDILAFKPSIVIVCINGKLGNMNVNEAIRLTKKLKPQVGIPSHCGMFAENTENPQKYIQGFDSIKGFEMHYGIVYSLNDILK